MNRTLTFFVSIFAIGIVVCVWFLYRDTYSALNDRMARVRFGKGEFLTEVADTKPLQEKGLGNRDGLCERCGMLFVFDQPSRYGFWMKDMRFPLDIVWIFDHRIVFIVEQVDFHDQKRIYAPSSIADSVVELPAGTVANLHLHEGDGVGIEWK